MTKQKSKAELLKDIQVERSRLERNLDNLNEMDMVQPGVVGEWSVKDVLAHLVAWEQLLLSWYASGLQGRMPEIAPVGMSGKAINALNQQIFTQYRQWSLEDVLEEFHTSYQHILAAVEAIPAADLFAPGRYQWTGKLLLADYIAGNTCHHYRWAKNHVRRLLKAKNRPCIG